MVTSLRKRPCLGKATLPKQPARGTVASGQVCKLDIKVSLSFEMSLTQHDSTNAWSLTPYLRSH